MRVYSEPNPESRDPNRYLEGIRFPLTLEKNDTSNMVSFQLSDVWESNGIKIDCTNRGR